MLQSEGYYQISKHFVVNLTIIDRDILQNRLPSLQNGVTNSFKLPFLHQIVFQVKRTVTNLADNGQRRVVRKIARLQVNVFWSITQTSLLSCMHLLIDLLKLDRFNDCVEALKNFCFFLISKCLHLDGILPTFQLSFLRVLESCTCQLMLFSIACRNCLFVHC